jgi:hypothetical protein
MAALLLAFGTLLWQLRSRAQQQPRLRPQLRQPAHAPSSSSSSSWAA